MRGLEGTDAFASFDMTSVAAILTEAKRAPTSMQRHDTCVDTSLVRGILLYGRSGALPWVAVCWCVLQCVAACCHVSWHVPGPRDLALWALRCVNRCRIQLCVAMCCYVLPCVAVCCRALPCVAVCCCVLLCVAVWCSVLRRGGLVESSSIVHGVAACCSVLLWVVVCCSDDLWKAPLQFMVL